jgi:membrane protease YdiL (CAAX protease family)
MRALVDRYPLFAYFVLAYAISWCGILIVAGHSGIPASSATRDNLFPAVFAAQVLGPPVAALVLWTALGGIAAIRAMFARIAIWRAPAICYVVALFAAPVAAFAVLLASSAVSQEYRPGVLVGENVVGLLMLGIAGGLLSGFLEEIGWTGFATERAPRSWGIVKAGLLIGVLHGVWHFVAGFWSDGDEYGALYFPHFILFWIGGLAALRVLIVWLYRRTGSLFLAQLAHASYTGSLLILWPSATPAANIAWTTAFVAVLWIIALVVAWRYPTGADA